MLEADRPPSAAWSKFPTIHLSGLDLVNSDITNLSQRLLSKAQRCNEAAAKQQPRQLPLQCRPSTFISSFTFPTTTPAAAALSCSACALPSQLPATGPGEACRVKLAAGLLAFTPLRLPGLLLGFGLLLPPNFRATPRIVRPISCPRRAWRAASFR